MNVNNNYTKTFNDIVINQKNQNELHAKLFDEYSNAENGYMSLFKMQDEELDKADINIYNISKELIDVHGKRSMFKRLGQNRSDANNILFRKFMPKDMKEGENVICSRDTFEKNFDIATNNALVCLDWKNIVVAGGSILSMLTTDTKNMTGEQIKNIFLNPDLFSDIDLFVYGLTDRQATKKLYDVYENIKKVIPHDIKCVRGPRAITFITEYPYRHIQIILRNFRTIAEILMSFDVDCCCYAYDGSNVLCTPRAHYATIHNMNTVNLNKRSASYEYRLAKYGRRGYGVYVPNFEEERMNEQIYLKQPHTISGLARLLVLEKLDGNSKFQIYRDVLDIHHATMRRNIEMKAKYEDSDYSKIYLPWDSKTTVNKIITMIEDKHKKINTSVDKSELKYMCYIGSMSEVVEGKYTKIPELTTEKEYMQYYVTYVNGRAQWQKSTSQEFEKNGIFRHFSDTDILEWYNGAYYEIDNNKVIDFVLKENYNGLYDLLTASHITFTGNETTEQKEIMLYEWRQSVLNIRDIACRTPLHLAISLEMVDMVKILLQNGADPMFISKLKKTPLHTACEIGNMEIIKIITDKLLEIDDALIGAKDSYSLSPILYTLMYGKIDAFKFLYQYAKEDDLVWNYKYNSKLSYYPLEMCLMYRQYDIAQYLLSNGYDPDDKYYTRALNMRNQHILGKSVSSHDYEMYTILMKNLTRKYKLSNLYKYSTNMQVRYDSARTVVEEEYYIKFIMSLYDAHGKKDVVFNLLNSMIYKQKFDQFKKTVDDYKINLSLVSDNKSILDKTEELHKKLMKDLTDLQSKGKETIIEKTNNNVSFTMDFGNFVFDKETIKDQSICESSIVPQWLLFHSLQNISNNKPMEVHHKENKMNNEPKILQLKENIKNLDTFIDYLTKKGILSVINKKNDIESDDEPVKTKQKRVEKHINFVMYDRNGKVHPSQANYFELYNFIKNGTLDAESLLNYDMYSYFSNDKFTPLRCAIKYNIFALDMLIRHMIDSTLKNSQKNNKKSKKISTELYNYKVDTIFWTTLFDDTLKFNVAAKDEKLWIVIFDIMRSYNTENKNYLRETIAEIFWNLVKIALKYNSLSELDALVETTMNENVNKELDFEKNSSVIYCSDNMGFIDYFLGKSSYFEITSSLLESLINNNRNVEIIEKILNRYPLMANSLHNGNTMLSKSITRNRPEVVECLISYGARCDISDDNGYFPIHRATININMMKLMLDRFPEELNRQTSTKQQTPLMVAISEYKTDAIDYLIEKDTLLTVRDVFGNTALHYAAIKTNLHAFRLIPYHNQENYFRMTPSDYVMNNMKSYYHHVRQEQRITNGSKMTTLLTYIVEIYKKHVSNKNESRITTSYKDVMNVNRYILSKLPDSVQTVPYELLA